MSIQTLKTYLSYIVLTLLIGVAGLLRLADLGYSDYQGDETQAFYLPTHASLWQFLMSQKKGPVQFLLTYLLKWLTNDYREVYFTRLPFALAGVLSCIAFYLVVNKLINKRAALYSTSMLIVSGLFVAFSRIVQYQSLVLLFSLLAIYYFIKFSETSLKKYLYISALFWAIGLLTHSDAMFIAPLLFFIHLYWMYQNKISIKGSINLLLPVGLFMLIALLSYYIPLVVNSSQSTQSYWFGRFNGEITNGIISSSYLFSLYQPIFGKEFYLVSGGFGLLFASISIFFNEGVKYNRFYLLGMLSWLGCGVLFMEFITKFPGTHIWVYVLPLIVFIGIAFDSLSNTLHVMKYIVPLLFIFIFSFFMSQTYTIFVDHTKEYPWERKAFLYWDLPQPNTGYQLSLFGFPYQRHWQEIADYIKEDNRASYYSTNDKSSIARYYMQAEKNSDLAGYFIHIVKPQTLTNVTLNPKGAFWMRLHEPDKVFLNGNTVVAKIYLVPVNFQY